MMQLIFFLLFAGLVTAQAQWVAPVKSGSSPFSWNGMDNSPRSLAMTLAEGNEGDGYQIHDGFWSGPLEKDKPVILEVFLFAGNDYRFSAANLDEYSELSLSIFDRWGYPAGQEFSGNASCATAGISVFYSGKYFIRLLMREGDNTDACMVYSYK